MKTVSCIIPCYNEESRLAAVLSAIVPLVSKELLEAFVINDGSTDLTENAAKKFPNIKVVNMPNNGGKSRAIAAGLETARGDLVLLLDADLIGLTSENVLELMEPVGAGRAKAAIAIRKDSPAWMRRIGVDFMSGQRVLPRQLLAEHLAEIRKLKGYALEVFINELLIKNNVTTRFVFWKNVTAANKWSKEPPLRGFWRELRMWLQITSTFSVWKLVKQNIALWKMARPKH
jgi:hypothetical protein